MTLLEALLLGVVQGLTEFLPVSSSGHLVLGKKLLGVAAEMPVTFEVVVHMGTLLATLIVFWKVVKEILVSLGRIVTRRSNSRPPDDPSCWLAVLIVVATIPAGLVGAFFEDNIESMFSSTPTVAVALCVTGALLFATRSAGGSPVVRNGPRQARADSIADVSLGQALAVGVAQAIAITPGISRSGSTIVTGLLCGIGPEAAATFSFLLSMPAIAGAIVLKARDISSAASAVGAAPLIAGFVSSLVVGYVALRLLLGFVRRGQLHWFAYYCWLIGLSAIVAYALGGLSGG